MTALSITAANVAYVSGPRDADQVAGEAFIAGASVYLSASGTWLKAQCDGTATEAGALGNGIALATADAANDRLSIARPGSVLTIAASGLTVGLVYYMGATAGAVNPVADIASTNKVTPVFLTVSATQVQLLGYNYNSGAVLA